MPRQTCLAAVQRTLSKPYPSCVKRPPDGCGRLESDRDNGAQFHTGVRYSTYIHPGAQLGSVRYFGLSQLPNETNRPNR